MRWLLSGKIGGCDISAATRHCPGAGGCHVRRSQRLRLLADGRRYPARIVGADVLADVALLQLQGAAGTSGSPAHGLVAAAIGDSKAMAAGAPVLAIGNQAGAGGAPAVTAGVISGLGQTIQAN